ncbi:MAG: hypothetical protein ACI4M1_02355 [Christensenellales bacterium]
MKNGSLKKIADKLFDDSLPDRFIDFLVAEMRSCGRLVTAPSESAIWHARTEFSSVK